MNKKNKIFLKLLLLIFILFGCSSLFIIDPEINQVERVGFLSVYINNQFYNRKDFKEDLGLEMLDFFKKEVTSENDFLLNLVDYFIHKFEEKVISSGLSENIEWMTPSSYVNSDSYQRSIKKSQNNITDQFNFDDSFNIENNYFTSAQGLKLLPLNKIVKKFNVSEDQIGAISSSVSYEEIGNFAEGLELDGVIIAEIDAGYEKLDFLEGSKIRPSITFRILLIDKNGKAVLTVGDLLKSERKRYKGKVVSAKLKDSYIDFTVDPSKPSELEKLSISYQEAINKALLDFFKRISDKWSQSS